MARFDRLGEALITLRERAGLTQKELARRAGITAGMLSGYENGSKEPTLQSLGSLLDALDLYLGTLDDALDFHNQRPPRRRSTLDPRGEPVEGVDLPRFLATGGEPLPPRASRAFVEMIRGFRQVARLLYHSGEGAAFEQDEETPPEESN